MLGYFNLEFFSRGFNSPLVDYLEVEHLHPRVVLDLRSKI